MDVLQKDSNGVAVMGEVQATPTSNTVLGRLKDLLTGIVLAASEAHIGRVGGYTARVSTTVTRPSDTTAYASGDLVANSTTASAVSPMTFAIARATGAGGMVRRTRIRKTGTGITNASFRLHLFNSTPVPSATVTITIASPGVVTSAAHGLATGCPVILATTGALPTGLTAATVYYAIVVDANTYQLATSSANAYAGTAINTSGSQSGVQTAVAGLGVGDNGALSLGTAPGLLGMSAYYAGALDVTFDKSFADGAAGNGVPAVGSEINFTSDTYYGLLEARGAYTPISGEVFTVELEVLQN